jgi:AcrR family transcriptional regulator
MTLSVKTAQYGYASSMGEPGISLRERTRRAVQGELMTAAMDLFLDQGFDATTVEQITSRTGLSRRSFFRYFDSKDDVLAQALAATGGMIAEALRARPDGEAPWTALRRAFDRLIAGMKTEPRTLQMTRMMLESPVLHSSHDPKPSSWNLALSEALLPRLGPDSPETRLRATSLSGAALACLTSAQSAWVAEGGRTSLAELLDVAMGAVAPVG